MAIGDQKTPARPIEIVFDPELGLPSDLATVLLLGHAASGATGINTVITINNVSDADAAKTEAETKFGVGSELAKMVVATVKANAGGGTFPKLKAVPLLSTDTGFGTSDAALTAVKATQADFIVSPYDATDSTLRGKLKDAAQTMSGALRTDNGQYGTIGVVANYSVTDPSLLPSPDTEFLAAMWLRDTGSNAYSIGELAAACAGKMGALGIPFNPQDGVTISSVPAPATQGDWITVGGGLESETALAKGWTPLRVKSNGDVAFVRTVTTRITLNADSVTVVGAYYDVQDFRVLYYWRKTLHTRFNQDDLKLVKASADVAKQLLSEVLRLAASFEDQQMFQAVKQLATQFKVVRGSTDRHRFNVTTPVNVIPGLHVVATTVRAGTQFDELVL